MVWAPAAGLLSLETLLLSWPCNNGGVCARSAGQGLMQEALPPAFRIAKFVTGLVTRHPTRKIREMIFAEVVLSV